MGSYNKDRDVFINRFWRKEDAMEYFHKMQQYIIYKSQTQRNQVNEHAGSAFGLLVHNS